MPLRHIIIICLSDFYTIRGRGTDSDPKFSEELYKLWETVSTYLWWWWGTFIQNRIKKNRVLGYYISQSEVSFCFISNEVLRHQSRSRYWPKRDVDILHSRG